jgi:hypothetical protein
MGARLLERGIKEMEQQIDGGIPAVEQLEKNKVFTQLSPKVERINRVSASILIAALAAAPSCTAIKHKQKLTAPRNLGSNTH